MNVLRIEQDTIEAFSAMMAAGIHRTFAVKNALSVSVKPDRTIVVSTAQSCGGVYHVATISDIGTMRKLGERTVYEFPIRLASPDYGLLLDPIRIAVYGAIHQSQVPFGESSGHHECIGHIDSAAKAEVRRYRSERPELFEGI